MNVPTGCLNKATGKRKLQFVTRDDARAHLRIMKRSPNTRDGRKDLHPYCCPDCRLWHLGHRGERYVT